MFAMMALKYEANTTQKDNLIIKLELGGHLEILFTTFSILLQHEPISIISSPLTVILDLIFIVMWFLLIIKSTSAVAWIEMFWPATNVNIRVLLDTNCYLILRVSHLFNINLLILNKYLMVIRSNLSLQQQRK